MTKAAQPGERATRGRANKLTEEQGGERAKQPANDQTSQKGEPLTELTEERGAASTSHISRTLTASKIDSQPKKNPSRSDADPEASSVDVAARSVHFKASGAHPEASIDHLAASGPDQSSSSATPSSSTHRVLFGIENVGIAKGASFSSVDPSSSTRPRHSLK
ncbi:unnamed protein product [Calypogeia fissa]